MSSESSDAAVGLLLVCFDGVGKAGKTRRALDQQIHADGGVVLDQVILRVNAKGKALVYDPRRTIAGALTPALTWGVFGLLTGGGLSGLVTWAIIGAVCGGLAGYYLEHSLTKNELRRIGKAMPAGSSAIAAFTRTHDGPGILLSTAGYDPMTASFAAIGDHLDTRIWHDAVSPTERPPVAPETQHPNAVTLASMVILRERGEHTLGDVIRRLPKDATVQPELLFEVDQNGKKRVSAPATGSAITAKSGAPWWAGFGLVFGLLAGWSGDGGVLGALQDGLVTAIAWGIFGLIAGGLYGLWAGRAISARRLKGVSPLLTPDTSAMIAWADGAVSKETISALSTPGTESLALCFTPTGHGVVIAVAP